MRPSGDCGGGGGGGGGCSCALTVNANQPQRVRSTGDSTRPLALHRLAFNTPRSQSSSLVSIVAALRAAAAIIAQREQRTAAAAAAAIVATTNASSRRRCVLVLVCTRLANSCRLYTKCARARARDTPPSTPNELSASDHQIVFVNVRAHVQPTVLFARSRLRSRTQAAR